MKDILTIALISIMMAGCGKRQYITVDVDNPKFKPNTVFIGSEDLSSPKFNHLIEKYQLDTIFHGETDEFKRILLLRHWIKSIIRIEDFGDPYPGDGNVEAMLDFALQGQGYHCGHFTRIQNAIMNAYGYVTRTLGAGPGVKGGPDGNHGINEIWLNGYNKWFLSDAKYDHHFEKDGIPLSALEVRDEYLKNKAADIIKVKGSERKPTDADPETGTKKEQSAQTYTWVAFDGYNDMFTVWPDYTTLRIMYDDEFFRNHTWIRSGKPYWTYDHPEFMLKVQDRDAIEWTPNTIASSVAIDGDKATIELISDTPNLEEYQMKELPSGSWVKVDSIIEIKLVARKHDILFRTMNLARVTGPVHKVVISSM